MKRLALFALIFFFSISIIVSCNEKKRNPDETSIRNIIIDSTSLLTNNQKSDLTVSIQKLEKEVGSQIAIVIVDTLRGQSLNEASLAIGEKLNLGRQKYRDGLLIFVAYKDRKVRIEVGYGLERIVRDEIARRIIGEKVTPRFKKEEYYEGLSDAVDEISELIKKNKQLIGKP
jgi:uncharacterized protein